MARYASSTDVSSSKSRDEIERTLARYGADQFLYGWESRQAVIAFRLEGRQIKFVLPLPDRKDFELTPSKKWLRSDSEIDKAYEQAVCQRWRAIALVIKAKLEAVDAGISIIEDEFMAHIVLPDGETVGNWIRPQLQDVYDTGVMPRMLPALASAS